MSSPVIGFVRLGIMGKPMARNLLKRVTCGLYIIGAAQRLTS